MRYFLNDTTLFIRGSFRSAVFGIRKTIARVSTILVHSVPAGFNPEHTEKELELAVAAYGFGRDYSGFVSTAPITSLCVLQYDFLTFFIIAGAPPGKSRGVQAGTITTVVCSSQGMSDAALREAAVTAGEATAEALAAEGRDSAGPAAGTVIVASEGEPEHTGAGPESAAGTRIRTALFYGIPESIRRRGGPAPKRPAFFVFSRFKGEHWVEWTPENCPYYPCHFEGQRCDFCYCPFYPCGDESLGQWTQSSNGGRVWNCATCTMIHEPAVADYLKKYPETSIAELKRIRTRRKGVLHP